MYNKTLLAVVVNTFIAMFIISSSFQKIYGDKLSYLTKPANTSINSTSVGESIFKGVSNSSISTGQSSSSAISNSIQASNNNTKVVILSFDDNRKGDFIYGNPILDKYGFKATFFIICGKTTDRGAMNWQDIALQKDGMDIDELDKMAGQFQEKLLNFMESGHIKVDQMRKQYDFKIKGTKVFAVCNKIARLSRPLQSLSVILER